MAEEMPPARPYTGREDDPVLRDIVNNVIRKMINENPSVTFNAAHMYETGINALADYRKQLLDDSSIVSENLENCKNLFRH